MDLGQQLYCKIDEGNEYFEVQMINSTFGQCEVVLNYTLMQETSKISEISITTSNVSLYSRFGERVEGSTQFTVLWGTQSSLWPTVTSAVAASNQTIMVKGDGFVAGWSRCLVENGGKSYQTEGIVISRYLIECQKPANESNFVD